MFQIIDTIPDYNEEWVSVAGSTVDIVFNEDIDITSISDMVLSVGIAGSDPFASIAGRLTNPESKLLRFTPDEDLPYNTRFIVIVSGGTYGIKSTEGRTLADDYVLYFNTEAEDIPVSDPEEGGEQPTDGIPMAVSATAPVTQSADNGVLTLYYAENLPVDTIVYVSSKHPLGRTGGSDYWKDNHTVVVEDNKITISSKGELAVGLKPSALKYGETLFIETTIPVVSYTEVHDEAHDPVDYLDCIFDFAVNRQYNINIQIPEKGQHNVTFIAYMAPSFVTVEEVKFGIKGLDALYIDNDEIAIAIYLDSLEAFRLWTYSGAAFPAAVPYYVHQYVLGKMTLRTLERYTLRGSSSISDVGNITLGDFKVAMQSSQSSSNSVIDVPEMTNQVQELVYILARKLKVQDKGILPVYVPTYGLLGSEPTHAVLCANPVGSVHGLDDPTNRNSVINRMF